MRSVLQKDNAMIDPLKTFDWGSLYSEYDKKCLKSSRYKNSASALDCFSVPPQTDRELYYLLLPRITNERKTQALMTLETYKAIVY